MTSCAITAFKALNGIFTVYKPRYLGSNTLVDKIKTQLSRDLNAMEVRPVSSRVLIDGSLSKGENLTVKTVTNYADHPLVVGPRYPPKDIKIFLVNKLDWSSSGVIPVGVGSSGVFHAMKLQRSNPIRSYELTGRLGYATDNFCISGEVREKATFGHVTRGRLEAFLARMENNHQTLMWSTAGVDIKSQEAYELASKGLVKPGQRKSTPIIYSVKCIEFNNPYFTLEVQCVNEWSIFLKRLIHDIGIGLKTYATCTQLRCIRYGKYTIDDSLLLNQTDLESVMNMMEYFDPKRRGLVRPMINHDFIDELDDSDDFNANLTQEELEAMTFKFEKDGDGYIDETIPINGRL